MDISTLMIARRLLAKAGWIDYEKMTGRRPSNLKEEMEADQVSLSPEARQVEKPHQASATPGSNEVHIRLSDLIDKLRGFNSPAGVEQAANEAGVTIEMVHEEIHIELEFTSRSSEPFQGLIKHDNKNAETDRYLLSFKDGQTFTIHDKWTNRSTTIWGDPHVDLSDMQGAANGEFSDLKSSNSHTTLMLQDGTRVTFTAQDNGIIEAVDIFKDGQHLQGLGAAHEDWQANPLFSGDIDQRSDSLVSRGDVVYAGGDGNDWFDAARRLVWGKTTGPTAVTRPLTYLELSYRQSISRTSIQVTA